MANTTSCILALIKYFVVWDFRIIVNKKAGHTFHAQKSKKLALPQFLFDSSRTGSMQIHVFNSQKPNRNCGKNAKMSLDNSVKNRCMKLNGARQVNFQGEFTP